ncbi:hypothetical protein SLS53_005983 [Cytospora paraplurivora]|uniref:Sphingolipid long chain base-responsive protein LSP1 n=1 Tax=Cytospora paraplurivora TaxID=2898453 RepID=A0AAN9YFH2_9PEZI
MTNTGGGAGNSGGSRHGFSLSSLRGSIQPELSRKLYKLIKTNNNLITAYETAGKERLSIATQLSEWGEQTGDEAVSDVSDKVGVIISELGEQEDSYAHALDDSRGLLKSIRNTEKSVHPSRENKRKITDEIARLKNKEPESTKLPVLEQELVRAEAENLVAEAQLTNVTREKLKEAYDAEFLATIERAEKQIILARHGRRLLQLLDDTPVVPGDQRHPYAHGGQARQILNDAEDDLRDWQPERDTRRDSDNEYRQPVIQRHSLDGPGGSGFEGERRVEQTTVPPVSDRVPVSEREPLGEEQRTGDGYLSKNHVVEITPGQNSQGEHESVVEGRGRRGDDPTLGEVSSADVTVGGRHDVGTTNTETAAQSPQQKPEGGPIATVPESPVSSVGGWREKNGGESLLVGQKPQGLVS